MSLLLVLGLAALGSSLSGLVLARSRSRRSVPDAVVATKAPALDPLSDARFRLGDVLVLEGGGEIWLERAALLSDPLPRFVLYFAGGVGKRRFVLVEHGAGGKVHLLEACQLEGLSAEPPLRIEWARKLFERKRRLPLRTVSFAVAPSEPDVPSDSTARPEALELPGEVLFVDYRHEDEFLLALIGGASPLTAHGALLREGSFDHLPRKDEEPSVSVRREGA